MVLATNVVIGIASAYKSISIAEKEAIVWSLRELNTDLSSKIAKSAVSGPTHKRKRPLHNGRLKFNEQQSISTSSAEPMTAEMSAAVSATEDNIETPSKPFDKGGRGYRCCTCSYSTPSRGNIVKHCNIHNNFRPFACSHCEQKFTSKSNLNAHMQRHCDELNFECTDCSMIFNTRADLSHHIKHHKTEQASLVGPCLLPSCSKQGIHFSNLSLHLLKVHGISSRRTYVARLRTDLADQLRAAGQNDACSCPEHDAWIFKYVGLCHNCYLCECPLTFKPGLYERTCKFRL